MGQPGEKKTQLIMERQGSSYLNSDSAGKTVRPSNGKHEYFKQATLESGELRPRARVQACQSGILQRQQWSQYNKAITRGQRAVKLSGHRLKRNPWRRAGRPRVLVRRKSNRPKDVHPSRESRSRPIPKGKLD